MPLQKSTGGKLIKFGTPGHPTTLWGQLMHECCCNQYFCIKEVYKPPTTPPGTGNCPIDLTITWNTSYPGWAATYSKALRFDEFGNAGNTHLKAYGKLFGPVTGATQTLNITCQCGWFVTSGLGMFTTRYQGGGVLTHQGFGSRYGPSTSSPVKYTDVLILGQIDWIGRFSASPPGKWYNVGYNRVYFNWPKSITTSPTTIDWNVVWSYGETAWPPYNDPAWAIRMTTDMPTTGTGGMSLDANIPTANNYDCFGSNGNDYFGAVTHGPWTLSWQKGAGFSPTRSGNLSELLRICD